MPELDDLSRLDRRDQELAKLNEDDRQRFAERTEFHRANHDGDDPTLERQLQWIAVLGRHAQVAESKERLRALRDTDERQDRAERDRELKQSHTAEVRKATPAQKPQPAPEVAQHTEPHNRPRDYSELAETHRKVADLMQRDAGQGQPSTMRSLVQLQDLSQQAAAWRDRFGIQPKDDSVREREALAEQQRADQHEVGDRQRGDAIEARSAAGGAIAKDGHDRERDLLGHQHLAERVGLELRLLERELRETRPAEADQMRQGRPRRLCGCAGTASAAPRPAQPSGPRRRPGCSGAAAGRGQAGSDPGGLAARP